MLEYSVPDDETFIKKWEGKKDEFGNLYFDVIRENGEIKKVVPGKRQWRWDD